MARKKSVNAPLSSYGLQRPALIFLVHCELPGGDLIPLLSPVLSKIEKQIQRENVIHAIDIGCVDELVEIPNLLPRIVITHGEELAKAKGAHRTITRTRWGDLTIRMC